LHPEPTLTLIGLSHRTAPVAARERYAISSGDLPTRLGSIAAIKGVQEAFALSTCNRTEVLLVSDHDVDATDETLRAVFRDAETDHVYVFRGVPAIIHVFRVASGLDSLVFGESEILAQLKTSLAVARDSGTVKDVLRPLLEQALRVGKRVRSETEVGEGTLSVARVGVGVAERIFTNFGRRRAVVIGAGETGVLTAKHLYERGIRDLHFANRTLERAQRAAQEIGGEAHSLDELPELVSHADVVVACVDGAGVTFGRETFDKKYVARRDRPLLVIDLSVPRAIDPSVGTYENLLLYDLDDLENVVEENRDRRVQASGATAEILVGEVHKFLALRTFAAFTPAIAKLRERFEEVREETLDEVCGDSVAAKDVELAHTLARRLLDVALSQMKASARHTSSPEMLDRMYQRFLEEL